MVIRAFTFSFSPFSVSSHRSRSLLVLPLNVSLFRSSVGAGFDVLSSVKAVFDVLFSVCYYCVVSGCKRGVPAHSACAQHQRRWQAEDYVCSYLHQGYWKETSQHCLQESRCRHEQEVCFVSLSRVFSNVIEVHSKVINTSFRPNIVVLCFVFVSKVWIMFPF